MLIVLFFGILNFALGSEFYGDQESHSIQSTDVSQSSLLPQNQANGTQSFDRTVSIAAMFNSNLYENSFDDSVNYLFQRRNLALLLSTFRFFSFGNDPELSTSLEVLPHQSLNEAALRDRISNEVDLGVFITQNMTLLAMEPGRFYQQILENYRQQISSGRSYVTKQEVMNWIYGQSAVARHESSLDVDLPVTDKLFTDIVHLTSTRPYVVQINTFNQLRRNNSRLPNLGHLVNECVNYGLIDSFKYWQSRNFAVADYNNLLAEGDLVLSPFAHGEPCYATVDDGLQFLQMQNVNLASLDVRQREILSNSYVSCADLVKIVKKDQ